jgi:hypothetical protein
MPVGGCPKSPLERICHCGLDPQSPENQCPFFGGIPRQARDDRLLRQPLQTPRCAFGLHGVIHFERVRLYAASGIWGDSRIAPTGILDK